MEAVVHLTKCGERTTLASARIAKFISYILGIPLIDDQESAQAMRFEQFERLIIVNSPMGFCDFRDEFYDIALKAKELIWCQNDYAIDIPGKIKSTIKEIWSSVYSPKAKYINWNMLSTIQNLPLGTKRIPGLFYYGAWRKGREKYFKEYLATDLYPVMVSASIKAQENYRINLSPVPKIFKPYESPAQLTSFDATIYIEDEYSHDVFCSPANRFYECLSAGIAIAFDIFTVNTMNHIIDIPTEWTVNNAKAMENFLKKDTRAIAREQRKLWMRDYVNELSKNLLTLAG